MGLLFSKYRKKVDFESPISIVEELLSEIKIKEFYENNMTGEYQDRLENINELITSIDDYSSHNINSKLFDYLEEVSLLTDIDKWNNQEVFDLKGNKMGKISKNLYEINNTLNNNMIDLEGRFIMDNEDPVFYFGKY